MDISKPSKRSKSVKIMLAGGYFNKGIIIIQGLLLMPLYLHYIGDRMYGLWLASGGVLAWLGMLDLGLGDLLVQRVANAYGRKNFQQAAQYFVNGFIIFIILGLLFLLLSIATSFILPKLFGMTGKEAEIIIKCFQLISLVAFAEFLNNCLRGFAQALQRPAFPAITAGIFRIFGITIIVLLLVNNCALFSIPIGLMFNSVPVLIVNILYSVKLTSALKHKWKRSISRNIIIEYIKISPAIFASRVGSSVLKNIEPFLISVISIPELAPVYVMTKRAGEMVEQILQELNFAIFPSFVHIYAENNLPKISQTIFNILVMVLGIGSLCCSIYIAANQSFVNLWVGEKYFAGSSVSLLIGIAVFMCIAGNLMIRLNISVGNITTTSYAIFLEAVLRVCLMTVFLLGFGLIGIPLGVFISSSIFVTIYYLIFRKKITIFWAVKYRWIRPVLQIFVVFIVGFILSHYYHSSLGLLEWLAYLLFSISLLAFVCIIINHDLRKLLLKYLH